MELFTRAQRGVEKSSHAHARIEEMHNQLRSSDTEKWGEPMMQELCCALFEALVVRANEPEQRGDPDIVKEVRDTIKDFQSSQLPGTYRLVRSEVEGHWKTFYTMAVCILNVGAPQEGSAAETTLNLPPDGASKMGNFFRVHNDDAGSKSLKLREQLGLHELAPVQCDHLDIRHGPNSASFEETSDSGIEIRWNVSDGRRPILNKEGKIRSHEPVPSASVSTEGDGEASASVEPNDNAEQAPLIVEEPLPFVSILAIENGEAVTPKLCSAKLIYLDMTDPLLTSRF
ncbi:hypothetical protein PENSPDRAFT_341483 [Peniophora sp. CONT]|nr:hypothetical protein PENSPDRAFT_341483 [Peniophora sp. CONT]